MLYEQDKKRKESNNGIYFILSPNSKINVEWFV